MPFCLIDRKETLVAGLPVRSPRRALGKVRDPHLEKAWFAVLNGETSGPLAATYTDYAEEVGSYFVQTVGYCCESLDSVPPGYMVSRLPAGTYAKFSVTGDDFAEIFSRLWEEIWEAERRGEIDRTFTGDFEYYPHAFGVDLYVAVRSTKCGELQ